MAGEARTQAFSIGTATVMLGPVADLWTLNPSQHSIGLVKDFTVSAEPTYTELRQGVKNTLVYSILTQNEVRASCSVYEYTGKNMRYALGISPGTFESYTTSLVTAVDGSSTKVATIDVPAVTGDDSDADNIKTELQGKGFTTGSWVYIHDTSGNRDKVHVAEIKQDISGTVATGSNSDAKATVTFTSATEVKGAFPAGSVVGVIDKVEAGVKTEQDFYSMKVVGILPQDSKPIVLLVPKVRVIRGFSINFSTDDFQNMPFEFGMFEPVSGDGTVGDLPDGGVMSVLTP